MAEAEKEIAKEIEESEPGRRGKGKERLVREGCFFRRVSLTTWDLCSRVALAFLREPSRFIHH